MKILIDTNIVPDVMLKREPFYRVAVEIPGLSKRNDFEDPLQYSVALLREMDGIVTRNPDDYKESEIKVWRPEELLQE